MAMHSSDVTAGTNATSTQYNNLREDVRLAIKDPQSDNSGAFDLTTGAIQVRTLDGTNGSITFSNAVAGQSFMVILKQDATGSRTATWPTVKWPNATAPTLTTTANRIDIFTFFYDGTDVINIGQIQNLG